MHDAPERRTEQVRRLIRAVPHDGGSRADLAKKFQLGCHKRCDGFKDIYGRMAWDKVAPTLTTGCYNPSRGRFLHPEEDRAITMREAALLQTFPRKYVLPISLGRSHLANLIGNALPPELVRRLAAEVRRYLERGEAAEDRTDFLGKRSAARMGDNLTPAQRSYCMSRVKGADTTPEVALRSALHRRGFRFRKHVRDLPGKPDIVFPRHRVAVFVDGEFWHGYRFPQWKDQLAEFWQKKIAANRRRDGRNFRRLRRDGWTVIRVWQRQVERHLGRVVAKIEVALHHNEPGC